jgi:CheY-like chemotaxis protein
LPPLGILVVEDHEVTARMLRFLLSREGRDSAVAKNGADAVWLARLTRFDLFLADLTLPDCDGCELIGSGDRTYDM